MTVEEYVQKELAAAFLRDESAHVAVDRFCGECGRRLKPFESDRFPDDLWAACPRWLSAIHMVFGNGRKHDAVIVGKVVKRPPKFDRATGQPAEYSGDQRP